MNATEQIIQEILNTFRDDGIATYAENFISMLKNRGFSIIRTQDAETLLALAKTLSEASKVEIE